MGRGRRFAGRTEEIIMFTANVYKIGCTYTATFTILSEAIAYIDRVSDGFVIVPHAHVLVPGSDRPVFTQNGGRREAEAEYCL